MDDLQIIELYFARDEHAIKETDHKYGKLCFRVAKNLLFNNEDSEECVNDTWNGAWNAMPPEKPTRLSSFLARITRNIAIDRYRHNNAQKRTAEVEVAMEEYWECIPNGEASVEDMLALKQAINGFLARLDARSRVIFMRRYWYSMPIKAIADSMRLSESHVSVILHRTRSKFKDYLTKEGIFV